MDLDAIANRVIEVCDSTNDLARALGEAGYPHGTWVSTRFQEKGRGRIGREWTSLRGGLFLSVVVRPGICAPAGTDGSPMSWTGITSAVAVSDALCELGPEGKRIRIKWPNDIYLQGIDPRSGAKAGGILCEAVSRRDQLFIIVGVGLNCASAPQDLDQPTASLVGEADTMRPLVLKHLLAWLGELYEKGPARTRERFEKVAWFKPGDEITWNAGRGRGQVRGMGESGQLIVWDEVQNKQVSLYAEDVSTTRAFHPVYS